MVDSDIPKENETISWAAYHASQQQTTRSSEETNVDLTSLLLLFHDEAKSVAMIRHSMNIVRTAVHILNPGQIPILTCDQPLYSLAKQIQWSWPACYGENQFIVMFGGLHIEMTSFKVLGDLLEGSGWTEALVKAGVASSGTADSFLKASHVTRTRRAHQITASSLYLLQRSVYKEYMHNLETTGDVVTFENWCNAKFDTCPQFQFWFLILQLELAVLVYVRSIREADFLLYIESLSKIVPWFFALDRTNYSRWVPIHIRDMISLKKLHPHVYAKFLKGKLSLRNQSVPFLQLLLTRPMNRTMLW